MTETEAKTIIARGESTEVEFKECREDLSRNVFDTVCAFSNRFGGHIFLGVNDKKQIIGVNSEKVGKIILEFVTEINNPQKMYPPLYLTPEILTIDEKQVIYIRVPEGSQVQKHKDKYWDRLFEGDINISNNMEQMSKLFRRKSEESFVNKVYPNIDEDWLDLQTIEKARKLASARKADHIWNGMSNKELLRSANLLLRDKENNKEGITLAAVLLFGKEQSIMTVLPQYKTDAILRIENLDRYDDREIVTTNLIESYYKLMDFGKKHLNDLFILDGVQNVSARNNILREIIVNTLAHRDYSSGYVAKLVIEKERIFVENANIARGMGMVNMEDFKPYSKNPSIAAVFKEIGFADSLGSGIRNLYKYTQMYSEEEPKLEEGDVFRTIVPIKKIATAKAGGQTEIWQKVPRKSLESPSKVPRKSFESPSIKPQRQIEKIEDKIRQMIKENNLITRNEIAEECGISEKTVTRYIKKMKEFIYTGKGKNGCWIKVNEENSIK